MAEEYSDEILNEHDDAKSLVLQRERELEKIEEDLQTAKNWLEEAKEEYKFFCEDNPDLLKSGKVQPLEL